ncbi:MAG TPA: NAD(P)/FAD-dependent oxidoreductase [Desulfobacteraceae bacterium]|nr:NAD(P)/FAD-dependent oxidoreductase [Desulfobacteraceae bacterium]
MKTYDVIVIGSGTGGQTAAYELKKSGLDVALVEKARRPGGTCALTGCQPKKWFYEVAEVVAKSRHLEDRGLSTAAWGDWQGVREQKRRFTDSVPQSTVKRLTQKGIDFIRGNAVFKDAYTLEAKDSRLRADAFVVATGAKPADMDFEGKEHLVSSADFLDQGDLPGRITFVGGGFISFEFAHFAARIGGKNRQITILETHDRPLRIFDADMVALLQKASAEEGITVKTETGISGIEKRDAAFVVRTASGEAFETDLVVHGAGRSPDTDGLNLDGIGVRSTPKGIRVNEHMQTDLPHIFAVGDCADSPALARVADYEARVAAENIISLRDKDGVSSRVDYRAVPFVLFTYPQCGMAGKTEAALASEGIPYKKHTAEGLDWPTYRRVGLRHAGFKVLTSEDGRILGAHVVSDHAAGMIHTFSRAMADGTQVSRLYRDSIMVPYPSRISDLTYMLEPLTDVKTTENERKDFMKSKDAYEEKMEEQLEKWRAGIDELKRKADKAELEARMEYHRQIDKLRAMQRSSEEKLKELKASGDDAWEDMKAGMDMAWGALEQAVKSAASRFK